MRPRLRQAPPPPSAPRNAPVLFEPWPHSSQPEIGFVSSVLSPLPPAIGQQRFPSKLVRRNHKNAVCVGVADVNDFQVATAPRPANGYAGTVPSRTIFPGIPQDFFY